MAKSIADAMLRRGHGFMGINLVAIIPLAVVYAALPIVRRRKYGSDREATQITGGEGEKAERSKGRRQRRQQPKCQRCHAAAHDDCKRGIVKLYGVVVHHVGGREERVEVERHGGQDGGHYWLPAHGYCKAGWYEEETQGAAKGRERLQRRQHREFEGRRANDGASGAQRECESSAIGKIAFRRKQQNQDRYEYDRRDAVWPGGRDPEKFDSTDSEKCACRIE